MALKRKDTGRMFSPSRGRKALSRSGLGLSRSPRRGLSTSFSKSTPKAKPAAKFSHVPKAASANMKVVVRVRPLSQREIQSNARVIVDVVDDKMVVFDPKRDEESFFFHGAKQKSRDMLKRENKNAQFLFDRVFGSEASNEEVFEGSSKGIVSSVLDGYNCSVFVYGATGAGKTYTMLGTQENPGITFRTMVALFKEIDCQKNEKDFDIGVSYLEVYNETVRDLLNPSSSLLHLREDGVGVVVAGLKMERIADPQKMFELLEFGNKNRSQHPTDANAESSRSHAVFQVFIKMKTKSNGQTKVVKLSMIDLAGSERGAATGCAGVRFKEGSNINKSLLALGNCINALADGHRHVPYRDSKLTRILKDSLGGNCQTVMIANVSPSHSTYEDSHNTLRYATRAKSIKVQIKRNIVSVELHVSHYIKMVEDLQAENDRLKKELLEAKARKVATVPVKDPEPVNDAPTRSHLPPAVAAAIAALNDKVKPDVSLSTVAVNTSPCKGLFNSEDLQRLRDEAEKLYNEKAQIHQRYLKMDSSHKVLQFRIKMKQRTMDRVQAMSSTPSRMDKAQVKVDNSVGQFKGRLTSAEECQESVSVEEREINQRLENVRKELQRLRIFDEVSPYLTAFELQFLNQELSVKCEHLKKLVEYLDQELENQDEMLLKVSRVFRHYYHLVRGHGHMTEEMAKEHEGVMQCLQGIKAVKWNLNQEDQQSSTVKSWLAEVPVTSAQSAFQSSIEVPTNEAESQIQSSTESSSTLHQRQSPLLSSGIPEDRCEMHVQSPVCSSSSYPSLVCQSDDTSSMLDSLGLLESKVESILNTSVSSTAVEVGNYLGRDDNTDDKARPQNIPSNPEACLNSTFSKDEPLQENINLNQTFEKPDNPSYDLPVIHTEAEDNEVGVLNGTFSIDDNTSKTCASDHPTSSFLKKLYSPTLKKKEDPMASLTIQGLSGSSSAIDSIRVASPSKIPSPSKVPFSSLTMPLTALSGKVSNASASSSPTLSLQATGQSKKAVNASASSPTFNLPVSTNTKKVGITALSSPTFAVPQVPPLKKGATATPSPLPSAVKPGVGLKKTTYGVIGEKRKALHNTNLVITKPSSTKLISINRRVAAPNSKLLNTPSKVKLAWNKENKNAAPSNIVNTGTLVKNVGSTKSYKGPAKGPPSALNGTFTKPSP